MRWIAAVAVIVAFVAVDGISFGKKKTPKYPPSPHVASTDPRTPEDFGLVRNAVEVNIPKLNELACEQAELGGVPFSTVARAGDLIRAA